MKYSTAAGAPFDPERLKQVTQAAKPLGFVLGLLGILECVACVGLLLWKRWAWILVIALLGLDLLFVIGRKLLTGHAFGMYVAIIADVLLINAFIRRQNAYV